MSDLSELFGKVAYAETPEERDDAEREIRQMLADAKSAAITEAAAVGWDAAVAAMTYEDGTPVELAKNINPYRTETP